MFRIKEEDGATGGPRWEFSGGIPELGILATMITHTHLNNVQNEIVNAIEGSGMGLLESDQTQLYQAIKRLALNTRADIVVGPGGDSASLEEALAHAKSHSSILVTATQSIEEPLVISQDFLSIRFSWGRTITRGPAAPGHIFEVKGNGFKLEDLNVTASFSSLVMFAEPLPAVAFIRNCTLKGPPTSTIVAKAQPPNLDLSSTHIYDV